MVMLSESIVRDIVFRVVSREGSEATRHAILTLKEERKRELVSGISRCFDSDSILAGVAAISRIVELLNAFETTSHMRASLISELVQISRPEYLTHIRGTLSVWDRELFQTISVTDAFVIQRWLDAYSGKSHYSMAPDMSEYVLNFQI